MKLLDIPQGTIEWSVARFGRPTCSQYHRLLTQKKLQYAAGAETYLVELLTEWALGVPLDSEDLNRGTTWMGRGTDMEAEARKWYAFQQGVKVKQVGFMLRDDERTGGSPDGLVGDDGGLEIKCLGATGHVKALLGGVPDDWKAQVQGLMYISGRKWWDVCLYHPSLPKAVRRVERDEEYIEALDAALERFLNELDAGKRAFLSLPGFRPPAGAVMPPELVPA